MSNTAARDSERQQLLPGSTGYQDSEGSALESGGEENTMTRSGIHFLVPIAILAVPMLWLAFTGFVVVPPGELAVIVTLVREYSTCIGYIYWLKHEFTSTCVIMFVPIFSFTSSQGHVDVYEPGAHIRTPFVSTVNTMSTKTQLLSERNNMPTKEGLTVSLDVAL